MTTHDGHLPAPLIVVAGATGDLGGRIVRALKDRGAQVRALVRPDLPSDQRSGLEAAGVQVVAAAPTDVGALAEACSGAECVISALSGLRPVMIDRQSVPLN